MAEALKIDPEAVALLREVAAEPGSCLLRGGTRVQRLDLFRRDEAWASGSAMLGRAEAELVAVHREQLAWLLRELCLRELYESKGSLAVVNRYDARGLERKAIGDGETRRALERAERFEAETPREAETLVLVQSLCAAGAGRRPRVCELAAAAHRLVPSNQARLLAAIDYARTDGQRTAIELARGVLGGWPSEFHRARAWAVIGLAHARCQDQIEAHEAYARGCESGEPELLLLLTRALFAIRLGLREVAERTLRLAGDAGSADNPAIKVLVDQQLAWRRTGNWVPSVEEQRLARQLAEGLDGMAGRISDAFA